MLITEEGYCLRLDRGCSGSVRYNQEGTCVVTYFGLPGFTTSVQCALRCFKWDTKSDVHQRLTSGGLERGDKSTIIKSYPSLPTDAKVQRVHIDNLPLKEPRLLRDLISKCFSTLGDVLDIGFHLDGRMFYGSGYVVLDQNTQQPITETLVRELPWEEEGRKLLLKWDDMPQYCRYCQSLAHCKADCDELRNLQVCTTSSRTLNNAKCNSTTTEKECLAVVSSLKQFHPHLYGSQFTVYTDHAALGSILRIELPKERLELWIMALLQE